MPLRAALLAACTSDRTVASSRRWSRRYCASTAAGDALDGGVNVPPGCEAVRAGGASNGLRPCADVVEATASTAIVAANTFTDTDMVQDLQKASKGNGHAKWAQRV